MIDTAAIREDLHLNGPTYSVTNDLLDALDEIRAELDALRFEFSDAKGRSELVERAEKAENTILKVREQLVFCRRYPFAVDVLHHIEHAWDGAE